MKSEVNLRTTINLNEEMLHDLKEKCKKHDVSFQDLIKKSVSMFINDSEKLPEVWNTVKYQNKGTKYKKCHISMRMYEYETYIDARKFLKLSFSYIVASALAKYAELILLGETTCSYPHKSYTKIHIDKNNQTYFVICWGIPIETEVLELFKE
jgi:hypothetical protein